MRGALVISQSLRARASGTAQMVLRSAGSMQACGSSTGRHADERTISSIGSGAGSGMMCGGANFVTCARPQQLLGSVDSRTSCASSPTDCTCSAMCARWRSRSAAAALKAAVGIETIAAHLHGSAPFVRATPRGAAARGDARQRCRVWAALSVHYASQSLRDEAALGRATGVQKSAGAPGMRNCGLTSQAQHPDEDCQRPARSTSAPAAMYREFECQHAGHHRLLRRCAIRRAP